MFPVKKKISLQEENRRELLKNINQTQRDLESAYSNFQNVLEPELIDCYIYQVNAIQMKHQYLIRQLKEDSYAKNPLEVTGS